MRMEQEEMRKSRHGEGWAHGKVGTGQGAQTG